VQAQKPYYTVALAILEPSRFSGQIISSRLYCNPKALWKFNWFLSDFGYDVELLGRDEVDETQLIGLTGVVKISHVVLNGTSLLRLDGFAPLAAGRNSRPLIAMIRRNAPRATVPRPTEESHLRGGFVRISVALYLLIPSSSPAIIPLPSSVE
jgi:hypothetical protein